MTDPAPPHTESPAPQPDPQPPDTARDPAPDANPHSMHTQGDAARRRSRVTIVFAASLLLLIVLA